MTNYLQGRTALVTGAAVRLGAAIARKLASEGAALAVHYRSSGTEAEALCEEIRQAGGKASCFQADLVSEAAAVGLIQAVRRDMGGCDILVNNASLFNKDRLPDTTFEKLETEFWPNCWAPLFLIREFAAGLQAERGDVVNLLDRRVESLDTSCVPYLLSKKMLAEITRLAALEYAPRIRVNGVGPGAVLPPPGRDQAYLKEHAGPIPLETLSQPEEIADAVFSHLTQASVTGQILYIDGGQHLLGAKL